MPALLQGQSVSRGPQPPNNLNKLISLVTPVVLDAAPIGKNIGDVLVNTRSRIIYRRGVSK